MKKLWFKAKIYGYGWYPASWQGWIVTAIYVMLTLIIFRIVDLGGYSFIDTVVGMFIPFLILTLVLIAICMKTGEKAKWRWGKK